MTPVFMAHEHSHGVNTEHR